MYLKKIKIIGFKSFADETEIEFDPGMTAVVGPNGSGKSNILDAFKWIFGERSAKGLRSKNMDAIVFHGSKLRSPAGYAEASIQFDNSNNFFNFDHPYLEITRRYYMDGTSEYYINNTKSYRKEIERLLLDTGIGKSTYSIMEQGKVDQILYSKPEERRVLFEEASGISKFKLEKFESIKKLQDTNQNLIRINDIIQTMRKDLESKKNQAIKTKKFFKFKELQLGADKKIKYFKYSTFLTKLEEERENLKKLKVQNEELKNKIHKNQQELEKLENNKDSIEKVLQNNFIQISDLNSKKKLSEERVEKNNSLLKEVNDRLNENNKIINFEKSRLELISKEDVEADEKIHKIKIEAEEINRKIINLKQDKLNIENTINQNLLTIQSFEGKVESNEKLNFEFREKVKSVILEIINFLEELKKKNLQSENFRIKTKERLLETISQWKNNFKNHELNFSNELIEFENQLVTYIESDENLRRQLFDNNAILSEKEKIDQNIETVLLENDEYIKNIKISRKKVETNRELLEKTKSEIYFYEKKILELNSTISSKLKEKENLLNRKNESLTKLDELNKNLEKHTEKTNLFLNEIKEYNLELQNLTSLLNEFSKSIEYENDSLTQIKQKITDLKHEIFKNQKEFEETIPALSKMEGRCSGLLIQIDSLKETYYNEFNASIDDLSDEYQEFKINKTVEESTLKKISSKLEEIGSINPLAIEEYEHIKKEFDHYTSQRDDIISSKLTLEKILENMDLESEKLFNETFDKINANFQETFSILFSGGKAKLELIKNENSLESGIEIFIEPPGKKVQNIQSLSGGEKSLSVIALLFAIYIVKPSPFCILDEIDAALDDVNKLRFCNLLEQFKTKSQFIVITHAQATIEKANTIFGVTNEEPGVSKIISLRLEDAVNLNYENVAELAN